MKKLFTLALLSTTALVAADSTPKVGIVNLGNCFAESKSGKQEQASFESLRNQMTSLVQSKEKELQEINQNLSDPDYVDGLSPQGKKEIEEKQLKLQEEVGYYHQQFYQVLNQANSRLVQKVQAEVSQAAEKVAKTKNLNMIVNKETCFYYLPALDITQDVVKEMDKSFVPTEQNIPAPAEEQAKTE